MKKYIKKIILCLSLFMVLVSSMVFPSLAYTISEDNMSTWHDYMGTNTLHYAMYQKNISKNSYSYYSSYGQDYYILEQTIKPTAFGNYATFNGTMAFRFATSVDNLKSSYLYQLGYFDIPAVNRYYQTSTADGAIKIVVCDVKSLFDLYKNGSDLSDIPLFTYVTKYLDQYKTENITPTTNEKFVFTLIKKSFYENNAKNLFMGICIFPNVATAESIYINQYGQTLLANLNYVSVKKSYESLQSTYDTLNSDYDKLNSDYDILKDQYVDLVNEHTDCSGSLGDVQGENLLLQQQITSLQTQVGKLTTQNNNLTLENKDLRESLDNTNALSNLGNGIGQGFTNIIDSLSGLGVGGLTVGACITVAVVVFVVFIIIKLVLR